MTDFQTGVMTLIYLVIVLLFVLGVRKEFIDLKKLMKEDKLATVGDFLSLIMLVSFFSVGSAFYFKTLMG